MTAFRSRFVILGLLSVARFVRLIRCTGGSRVRPVAAATSRRQVGGGPAQYDTTPGEPGRADPGCPRGQEADASGGEEASPRREEAESSGAETRLEAHETG